MYLDEYESEMYPLTLDAAIQACKDGAFVTHKNFDSEQSMHYWKGDLFYEDGPNLTKAAYFDIYKEKWAEDGWVIKYPKEKINTELLDKMHQECNHFNVNYEKCVRKV